VGEKAGERARQRKHNKVFSRQLMYRSYRHFPLQREKRLYCF